MRLKRCFALALAACLAVVALRGQSPADDEIKLDSRPYIPPPDIAIRKRANLVEVRVVVRDAKGQPVAGLQQSDFELFDNGKPQVISAFSVETLAARAPASGAAAPTAAGTAPAPSASAAGPRYIALFFDDQNMPLRDLVPARTAAQGFVISHLQPGDRVGIFTSSTSVTLEFTEDRRKLLDSLAALRPRLRNPGGGGVACPRISPYQAHLIINMNDLDAINLGIEQAIAAHCFSRVPGDPFSMPQEAMAGRVKNQARQTLDMVDQFSRDTMRVLKNVIEYLGKMPGSRLMVLSSSGFLTMTSPLTREQNKLVDIALRAGVVINSLDAAGLVPDSAGGSLEDGPPISLPARPDLQSLSERIATEQRTMMSDPLAGLADGTGGRFFHNNNDLNRGLNELASAPSVSYLLGFAPETLKYDGSYHALKVKLASPAGHKLEARRGYNARERPPLPPSGFAVRFENEVMGSATISDIQVGVTAESARLPTGESGLRVVLRVDPKSLPFQRRGDRNAENLRFILALFDAQGKFLAGFDCAMDLNLKDDTLARLTEQGLSQGLTLQASPGAYKLRVVLEELMTGKMTALTRSVEIR